MKVFLLNLFLRKYSLKRAGSNPNSPVSTRQVQREYPQCLLRYFLKCRKDRNPETITEQIQQSASLYSFVNPNILHLKSRNARLTNPFRHFAFFFQCRTASRLKPWIRAGFALRAAFTLYLLLDVTKNFLKQYFIVHQ